MNGFGKGVLLAAAQLAIVLSLGGKLLVDRATRPRFWLKAAPVDPNLPIRGRYVSLRVEVPAAGVDLPPVPVRPSYLKDTEPWPSGRESYPVQVKLLVSPAGLMAGKAQAEEKRHEGFLNNALIRESNRALPTQQWTVVLREPLAFFIPEHVPDPSRRPQGEELWVEVTLPKQGPLRPIRLGVKQGGVIKPLDL
jgi:hypothetical protein